MHTTIYKRGGLTYTTVVADRPVQTVPVIAREYDDDGTRMYETKDGRHFKADIYDTNFKLPAKKKVISEKQLQAVRYLNAKMRGAKPAAL